MTKRNYFIVLYHTDSIYEMESSLPAAPSFAVGLIDKVYKSPREREEYGNRRGCCDIYIFFFK